MSVLIMAHSKEAADKKLPVLSKESYSALACLDTSDQTTVAGTQKCTDGFSLYKNGRKLED